MSHTPGPWFFQTVFPHREDEDSYDWVMGGDGSYVIQALGQSAEAFWIKNPADRDLIAAAPDLLEALENWENDDGHMPPAIWELRNKAIAKARGET